MEEQKKDKRSTGSYVLLGLVVLLLLFSVGQAFEISALKDKIQGSAAIVGGAAVQTAQQTATQSRQAQPPAMVGGC